jgi:dTDP-4-amino-4,6-dideoxygalactose transaminase
LTDPFHIIEKIWSIIFNQEFDLNEVPFVPPANPLENYLAYKEEIDRAVRRVLERGTYILGPEVASFEHEFAQYLGAEFCVGVANGTDALVLALWACGIGQGDAVFTVSHTAVATVAAVELTGAAPVLVDVDKQTYTMAVDSLEEAMLALTKGRYPRPVIPRAVVPVHLYGQPADMEPIMAFAEKYGLYVIEDCAQAHGASLLDRKVGTWGDVAAFSFYPTKNLGALGDGGAVVTNDSAVAEKIRILRQYGWKEDRVSEVPGFNSRLDELQAGVLRVKLKHLDADNLMRQKNAGIYGKALSGGDIALPQTLPGRVHVYHQYVVWTSRRDQLQTHLKGRGIGTAIHYPVPVHLQPAYVGRLVAKGTDLPNTEHLCKGILSLPMHPQLNAASSRRVCEAVRGFAE